MGRAVSAILDKPAVDTDIEHLDFPDESVACELQDTAHSDPMTATYRWRLSCGHGALVCEAHAEGLRKLIAMTADGVGWCQLDGSKKHLAYTVTLEPIHP